jgi:serine/threonine-protein kinase HipA
VNKVDVVFCGWGQHWTLGTLADNSREIIFEYSSEALTKGVEFSRLKLELRPQAYGQFPDYLAYLPGLVSDSLPDGWGLLLMNKVFLLQGRNPASISPLDRLSFIGDRAMGALSFRPSNALQLSKSDLDLVKLANAVRDVISDRETAALQELALIGGSPHGARPKALVQYDESKRAISTREDAPGVPWLVKFPAQHEHREVCAIEEAYCVMARSCGLEVPKTRFFDIDSKLSAFGIERFDRERGLRVPVHSFAGALHANFRLPSLDYQSILRATLFFTNDVAQVEAAFKRCVFNVVFNNRDDHAKNFSFRMSQALEWKLSPAYDLTFNAGPSGYHQTSVMGEALAPGRSHLLALAEDSGMRRTIAERLIDQMLDVSAQLDHGLRHSAIRRTTASTITSAVAQNVSRCARSQSAAKRRPRTAPP